jgi:hypothetical protein
MRFIFNKLACPTGVPRCPIAWDTGGRDLSDF